MRVDDAELTEDTSPPRPRGGRASARTTGGSHKGRPRGWRLALSGPWGAILALGAVMVTTLALTMPAEDSTRPTPTAPPAAPQQPGLDAHRFFATSSVWNTPLPADTSVLFDGSAARLANQARYSTQSSPVAGYYGPGYGVKIVMSTWSVPIYTVPATQPRAKVTWVDANGNPQNPAWASGLQSFLDAVPVPTGIAQLQANGRDGHLVIYSPASDEMWEFWRFSSNHGRYTARYAGYLPDVSKSSGVLPHQWGARATSLALAGGVILMSDYLAGVIPHALAISVPVITANHVAPATRDDGPAAAVPGQDARDAIPEGARFRLPASYNCATGLGSKPSKLLSMICVAARNYGLVVVDKTGGTVNMYAEDDRTVGTPYQQITSSPWTSIRSELSGPSGVLNHFPWESLQRVS